MNMMKNILNKKLLGALSVALLLANGAFAAKNNGCDENSGNDRINPEIALCSTHVYNIGKEQNPSTDNEKQFMRDVVALKTTVMTQQMYKQYEYLDSMIRRFKTQLEKAVLTTKLQAAGADTGEAGGSSYSGVSTSNSGTTSSRSGSNKYIVLNDAKNCNMESTLVGTLQCLLENINKTLVAIDNNDISGARRQLDADMEIATKPEFKVNKPASCKVLSNNAKSISTCAYDLRIAIMSAIETKQQAQNRNMMGAAAQQGSN